jgi:hypothetical protein
VVADAVAFEPVSTLEFPANREKNREFHQIRALGAILKADTRANSKASSEISCATEQGNNSEEQGNLAEEQGFCLRKPKSSPDEVFGTHRVFEEPSLWWPLFHSGLHLPHGDSLRGTFK